MARADGSVKAVHAAPPASTRQTDREAHLARCRSGQKLAQSNQLGIGFLGEPPATNHNLAMEIGKVSDRSQNEVRPSLRKVPNISLGRPRDMLGKPLLRLTDYSVGSLRCKPVYRQKEILVAGLGYPFGRGSPPGMTLGTDRKSAGNWSNRALRSNTIPSRSE
jgi:hypothetical protein